jgi:hypothetical protein
VALPSFFLTFEGLIEAFMDVVNLLSCLVSQDGFVRASSEVTIEKWLSSDPQGLLDKLAVCSFAPTSNNAVKRVAAVLSRNLMRTHKTVDVTRFVSEAILADSHDGYSLWAIATLSGSQRIPDVLAYEARAGQSLPCLFVWLCSSLPDRREALSALSRGTIDQAIVQPLYTVIEQDACSLEATLVEIVVELIGKRSENSMHLLRAIPSSSNWLAQLTREQFMWVIGEEDVPEQLADWLSHVNGRKMLERCMFDRAMDCAEVNLSVSLLAPIENLSLVADKQECEHLLDSSTKSFDLECIVISRSGKARKREKICLIFF